MRLHAALLSAALLLPMPLLADSVTYTYTGNDFTIIDGTVEPQPFTTSDFISGEFTLSAPLADNLALTLIDPTSFSFSDGVDTVTNLTATPGHGGIVVSTDATGDITQWGINLLFPSGGGTGEMEIYYIGNIASSEDDAHANKTDEGYSEGANVGSPGTWIVSDSAATPEPASLTLVGSGLLGLAGLTRRRVLVR